MAIVAKILQALAALVPAVLAWLDKRKAAQDKAEIEARNAAVRAAPADELQRKFNAAGRERDEPQPDPDQQADLKQPKNAAGWWDKHE